MEKIKLRLQTGLITGTIQIPIENLRSDYRIPIHRPMTVATVSEVQDMIAPHIPCLVFKWDGKSKWGGEQPILDLVDVTNY